MKLTREALEPIIRWLAWNLEHDRTRDSIPARYILRSDVETAIRDCELGSQSEAVLQVLMSAGYISEPPLSGTYQILESEVPTFRPTKELRGPWFEITGKASAERLTSQEPKPKGYEPSGPSIAVINSDLRHSLDDFWIAFDAVLKTADEVKAEVIRYDLPKQNDYPGFIPGSAPDDREGASNSILQKAYRQREVGWPRLLDQFVNDLQRFWHSWDEVERRFCNLSTGAAQRLNALRAEWVAKLFSSLGEQAEWVENHIISRREVATWNKQPNFDLKIMRLILMGSISKLQTDESAFPSSESARNVISKFCRDLKGLERGNPNGNGENRLKNSKVQAQDQCETKASTGTKRAILVTLSSKNATAYDLRMNAERIAAEGGAQVLATTIYRHTKWLAECGYIERTQEAGNSGYWLTSKGTKLAKKLSK